MNSSSDQMPFPGMRTRQAWFDSGYRIRDGAKAFMWCDIALYAFKQVVPYDVDHFTFDYREQLFIDDYCPPIPLELIP